METSCLFSVVTAAYNAARWLPDLYGSLNSQSLGFDRIQWIIVDDGSTDATEKIARSWAAKHPNIVFIRQNNGGVASARNAGIPHIRGEWTCFIDADDFVKADYFDVVREFIERTAYDGLVAACRMIFFHEDIREFHDTHHLNYRFSRGERIVNQLDEPEIHPFVNSSFFRSASILASKVRFDPSIRPSFEDAHFLACLQLDTQNYTVAFLDRAHYFYRKRSDQGSLITAGWGKIEKFRVQPLAYLKLAKLYFTTLGRVPAFIQQLILYDAYWYFTRMIEGGTPLCLPTDDRAKFFQMLRGVFVYIDKEQILFSRSPLFPLPFRFLALAVFKGLDWTDAPLVLEGQLLHSSQEFRAARYAQTRRAVMLRTPAGQTFPLREKIIEHVFQGESLGIEQHIIFALPEEGECGLEVDGVSVVTLAGDEALKTFTKKTLLNAVQKTGLPQTNNSREIYQNCNNAANMPS